MSRSDVIPIDSRSHLEVADRKHRYAKNLRTYFKEYHRINGLSEIVERSALSNESQTPSRKWTRYEPFFDWLDKEESPPNLPDCPRSVLDEDRVEYLTSEVERESYEITINGTGVGSDGVDGTKGEKLWRMTRTGEPVNTGSKGWIFVLLNGRMYACEKRTNTFPRFHHSSFFAGASVSAAGMLVCVNGKLTKLFPHSGHYRPHDRHLYSLLAFLREKEVDLSAVQVDVQRVMKLSRQQDKDGGKTKKTDSAFYLDGETAYHFLKSKTSFQECGALRHINKRRQDYTEGEEAVVVKTKAAAIVSVLSSPAIAEASVDSATPLSPIDTDALGQLPVLNKADSGDSHPSPSERTKLRLSIAPSSNRSSVNMNRLSLSSTGGYASTVGSTSPFCSPVAEHNVYPLHCSSSGGVIIDDNNVRREYVDTNDKNLCIALENDSQNASPKALQHVNTDGNKGLFGSSSGDEYCIEALLGQQKQQQVGQFDSGGRSSADARARLLNSMLYADTIAVPVQKESLDVSSCGNMSATTIERNKETLPSSPPISVSAPMVRATSNNSNVQVSSASTNINSSNYTANGNTVYVQNAVATPILKIPVAAPIKKVTSYSSISSSYGSSSFAQPQPMHVSRSRSTSKAEHDIEYDLRVLLAESPIVPMPEVNYFNYDTTAASPVYALGNYSNQYNMNNNNSNSTCNSRGRSRGSSYNPPYIPSTAINNNNTSTNSIVSAEYSSPAMDRHSPRSSLGSTSVPVTVSQTVNNDNIGSSSNSSTEKKVYATVGTRSSVSGTSNAVDVAGDQEEKSGIASAHLFSEDVLIPTSLKSTSASEYRSNDTVADPPHNHNEELNASSPQPSFASSLSSTDSLPNMLLSYVMSPGGTTLHHCFDDQGEGDGMYEERILGDSYHDHLYGGNGP